MKRVGIILNILGILLSFVFFANYFSSMSAINDHLNSGAISGGNDGPTSIFYTVKISREILLIVFTFIAIFCFNLWSFIKKPEK